MNSRPDPRMGIPDRVTRLEVMCEHILDEIRELRGEVRELRHNAANDFRILFGALIAVALGLSEVMAKGFAWI